MNDNAWNAYSRTKAAPELPNAAQPTPYSITTLREQDMVTMPQLQPTYQSQMQQQLMPASRQQLMPTITQTATQAAVPMPRDMQLSDMTEMEPRDSSYLVGFLQRSLGKAMVAEFIIGTNSFLDKSGVLREVGVNYFILEDFVSHSMVVCDLYSVKFITLM
ncbi:MAG: hypothetical protein LBN30_06970 [Oscillospiraceae bacterium]|jgi:hypothetical protein|nr:hypothetical protein [Oscillospiraceae bacterium]